MRQCSFSLGRVIRNPMLWLPPPQFWLDGGVICCAARGCGLAVVLFFSWFVVPSCLPFYFPLILPFCLLFLSFSCSLYLLLVVACAGLHLYTFVLLPPAHCGWHCMAKSPCCICNVYLCLVVYEYRARLSVRHQHRHRACWM